MPAEGRPPGPVVFLASLPAVLAIALVSVSADLVGLASRGEREPAWLAWAIAGALALLALAALALAWGILRAKPWAARRIRELADADDTIVLGALLQGLLGSERARRWFDA